MDDVPIGTSMCRRELLVGIDACPSVVNIANANPLYFYIHMQNSMRKSSRKWTCFIAMFDYRRVSLFSMILAFVWGNNYGCSLFSMCLNCFFTNTCLAHVVRSCQLFVEASTSMSTAPERNDLEWSHIIPVLGEYWEYPIYPNFIHLYVLVIVGSGFINPIK